MLEVVENPSGRFASQEIVQDGFCERLVGPCCVPEVEATSFWPYQEYAIRTDLYVQLSRNYSP
jgi:hypothetical protein